MTALRSLLSLIAIVFGPPASEGGIQDWVCDERLAARHIVEADEGLVGIAGFVLVSARDRRCGDLGSGVESQPMHARRWFLWPLLLAVVPLCGCRGASNMFWEGLWDSAWDAIDGEETPEEEWREFREQPDPRDPPRKSWPSTPPPA
jgi:hypothetical protein